MYNFFVDKPDEDGIYHITDGDFNHIKNVLRMKVGEEILVSFDGKSDLCTIESFLDNKVTARIKEKNFQNTCLPIDVYLFQGLPKSDKLELIVQKCTELGVKEIIPVEMVRSIVKLDEKKKKAKTERYQSIAESAGKQSKATFITKVRDAISFNEAINLSKKLDHVIVPYENKEGMESTKNALSLIKKGQSVGVFIGPEGGFDQKEIEKAMEINAKIISLGKRILRTETASIACVSMLAIHSEMNL